MKKYISILCVFILLINIFPIALAENEDEKTQEEASKNTTIDIDCKSAILIEASTGKVIFEKNSHEKLPPASVTKIMTLLLVMEAIDKGNIHKDDIVTTSEHASSMGGSQVYLAPGEEMTLHDMLKAVAVASANDASVALAEFIAGTEEEFVKRMNNRAKELGMKDTNFVNSNGLDHENHYTSAYDVALMSKELVKHEEIFDYLTIWTDSLRDGEFNLANTNKLIRFYEGCDGIKTGSTSVAKFCLSATAKRDGIRFISVIMAAPSSKERFAAASKLLDYGFANYQIEKVIKKGTKMGKIEVEKGMENEVDVIAEKDLSIVIKKLDKDKIDKQVKIEEIIAAPVEKGEKVGSVTITVNGKVVGECNLVTADSVEKITFKKILINLLNKWFNLNI